MNRQPKRLLQPMVWAVFAAIGLAPQAKAIDFPRPGVICDAPARVCYDRQGASVALTRLYYGPLASNQLLARLSGSPPQRDFLLSGGQLCDLGQRICWDDGWRRRLVSQALSQQLFGASPVSGPPAASSPAVPQAAGRERTCQLVQRGVPIFTGSCRLERQTESIWQYYVVQMDNGKLFRFQRRSNTLVLRDATGLWPVSIAERGGSVQFRWANLLLDVSRPMQFRGASGGGVIPPSPTPRSTGETGEDLLDNLFQ